MKQTVAVGVIKETVKKETNAGKGGAKAEKKGKKWGAQR